MKLKVQHLFGFLFAFLICHSIQAQDGYQVGDKASDFKLKNVDGSYVSMGDHDDAEGFLVIFSCNTCPYVVAYEDRMIALHNQFAPKGYPVIAINPNDDGASPGDSFEKMKERADAKNFPFAYVYDETQETTKEYGATNTPQVYLLEKDGNDYIVKYVGAIDNNYQDASSVTKKYVEDAMEAVLTGDEVPEKKTKAVGCTIKWRKS
ncbi:thioredoxin family protein [Pleomorphovibrio marinus]|uniref:thioredoxin family protein n=1 Tax=Pleomorphovibrio marinus TaxID=2164132 RepID=UPI000E0C5F91|nr:thioredoxin family protein [Pleomorphovibrio marinus]